MKCYIKAIEYYLPEKIVTTSQIAEKFPEWSADKIVAKVGVMERHVAAPNETATDMAYKAAEKLFVTNPTLRGQIDFVLLCSQSVDYRLPSSACILQHQLKLSTNCGAFDFNLGCSGYEYGLATAKGYIMAGVAKCVLLLTSETYTKYIHPNDKGNLTIFGDAATATIVSTDGFAEIGDFVLGTDGSGAESLIVKTGGSRYPKMSRKQIVDEEGNIHYSDYLYMNGGDIFSFSAKQVPNMVRNLLAKTDLQKKDVDLWIFHQANKYMINFIRKRLNIDRERFYVYMEKVGNTVSSTIPIALCEARKEGKLHGNVLLAGFGVGLSWGGVVIRCHC